VQMRLDGALRERIAQAQAGGGAPVSERLTELDAEWDIERLLIVNAATLASIGVVRGLVRRRPPILPLVVTGFLLQHGIQGWCPPLALFRRWGVRTRREIDLERYALKLVRGDFGATPELSPDDVLDVAARR